ncbi:autotransporter domain-containing protein [Salmonella enterica subsp. enterica serovar Typhi]|nr:autotransporter domain-containing protein [Salmonella enterica subsp. enterica serovar Typhi]
MQKKKLISIAIALTLQSYYIPAIAAENNDDEKECPSNIASLPKEKRAKLSPTCLATLPENDNHWGWVAGGVAALVAGVVIGVENNGGGDSTHSYIPPTPDDGGNVTPPDDSGDDDVTPPDDSGDDDVTPPDDDDTPPDDSVITFSNGVTIDKGKDTLAFDSFKLDSGSVLEGAVWNYSEQNNQWQLTPLGGKTLNVTGWDVTDANAAVIEGTQENGLYWKYDSRGYLILADDKTTVISGDGESHTSDRGMDISGQDRTGVIISGNRTVNTLTGGSSVTDGAIGMVITGDGTTNTISGHSTVDNATGALISGNIYANNSYAFSVAGAGHVVNNGTVVIADGVTGSGIIKQGDSVNVEGTNGNNGNSDEAHYADYTLPETPVEPGSNTTSGFAAGDTSGASNNLNGYVVGTNADGSAGQLKVSNASMEGVGINTGFTAGTADTTVSFDNVVEGSNLTDASAIQSTSVVWNAQGSQDSDGNVDVTMTKNAYADVATDGSVSDVAQALDAGYTNNELYTSLNVGTTAELNSALKQVSGSQATTVFREARVLSNRFNMLADAAPQIKDGLAFNVVAKGDPRAELGNDTQYDMLALRQKLDLTANQNLTLEYGIARLDGDGSQKAGDNGLTGGYSQFFGLKHSMAFDEGLAWNNSLRYDVHNLDSSRSVAYGDVNKIADSDARQQYMEFRSEGAKTFSLMDDALKVTPYAGVKFRHTMEDGYKERNAGDFNLSMNSGSETAVDSIVGMKLDYAGKDGWSATATLEGGPNLSYSKSQRTASLQGAAGQSFGVDDGQKGGGINGLATIGVKYSSNDTALHLDAYQWKEDGISDKGFMLNVKKTFR